MLSLDHPMLLGLQQFTVFSETDLYVLSQYFKPISYDKDTIILNIGEINDKLYFVEKGVLQEFSYQEDDLTNTHWLMPEGSFVYSTVSFINEIPTEMGIKAIEKVKLLYITKHDLTNYIRESTSDGAYRKACNRTNIDRIRKIFTFD